MDMNGLSLNLLISYISKLFYWLTKPNLCKKNNLMKIDVCLFTTHEDSQNYCLFFSDSVHYSWGQPKLLSRLQWFCSLLMRTAKIIVSSSVILFTTHEDSQNHCLVFSDSVHYSWGQPKSLSCLQWYKGKWDIDFFIHFFF
jgi:hypothetical protein